MTLLLFSEEVCIQYSVRDILPINVEKGGSRKYGTEKSVQYE